MKLDIKHITKLAHFSLSKKEELVMKKSIPTVVAYMSILRNLNLDKVNETSEVTEERNVTREDMVEPSFSQEEALKNAKHVYKGFFVVPYIFEGDKNAS